VGLQQDRKTPQASFGGWIEQSDGKPFPMEAQYTHYLIEKAIEKLDAASGEGGPIYLQLDIFDPHQPFSVPAGLEKREQEIRSWMRLPESYEAVRARDWKQSADEPKIYNFYQRSWGLYDPRTVLDYRVAHALQMEVIDRALGRFFGELKRRGLYDESLIIFTSDHGEMNGRRAVVDKGVYLYPDVLRVPLAVKMPRSADVSARAVGAPVSHLDVAPTLLELTGIQPMERLDGISLLPVLRGETAPADRNFLFECGWHTGVNFACAIQDQGRRLYTYNLSSTVDELYDLAAEDAVNLAGLPEHRDTHREMVRRLASVVENDPRWIGYWHSFRVDHYHELPKPKSGDYQMFRPI
jgi:hypothetical protein